MNEIVQQLLGYANSVWRRRWYALIVAWLVCLAGWVAVERIPDRYTSTARVYIDTESMLRPLMRGIAADLDTSMAAQLSLVRRTLLTRANLEEIVRTTDMDLTARTPAALEATIASLQARLELSAIQDNLFSISFVDPSPEQGYRVVQAVLDLFVEANLGANREELAVTQQFLGDQIQGIERQLNNRERMLTEFELENRGYLPGAQNYEARLQAAADELDRLRNERDRTAEELDRLNEELAHLLGGLRTGEAALSPQAQRVQDLERQLEEMRLLYTPQHPEVILTERLLERERERLERGVDSATAGMNPAVEQLRSVIRRQDVAVTAFDQRIDAQESAIVELRALIEQTPEVLAEHARLQRDVAVIRENYNALVNRREQARFAEELDTRTDAVQFRVVEPPTVPLTPSGPDRFLLRSGVLFGGIAAGIGFAFVLGLLSSVVSTTQRLSEITGRHVLGSITYIRLRRAQARHAAELVSFALAVVMLGGAYVGVVTGVASDRLTNLEFERLFTH